MERDRKGKAKDMDEKDLKGENKERKGEEIEKVRRK